MGTMGARLALLARVPLNTKVSSSANDPISTRVITFAFRATE